MRQRFLILFAAVTAVAVAIAAWLLLCRQPDAGADRASLLPDFAARLADVAEIAITARESQVTLGRADGGAWVLPDKSGYPADGVQVRRLLLAVANLQVIERKTDNPELYNRLGVQDPRAADAASVLVAFKDRDGVAVAALIVGDAAPGSAERRYVRRPDEAPSYLVQGMPQVKADAAEWLNDTLLTVDQDRVRRIEVRRGDATLTLARDKPEDALQLAELPKGRALKAYGGVDAAAASLAYLAFDDVRPAAAMPDTAVRVVTETFDGLAVTTVISDGWAHFSAAYNAQAATQPGAAVMPKAPADGEKEADDINARLAAWNYKLPDYKIKDLAPTLDDLLEPVAEKK